MLKHTKLVWFFALLLMLGCASQKRFNAHQSEIDNLRREIKFLKDQISQLRRELDEFKKPISEQELVIRQNKADLASQMAEVTQKLEEVQNQLQDTNYRITALMQRSGRVLPESTPTENIPSATDTLTSIAPTSTQPIAVDQSREMYNTAYRDLIRGNYQLALQGFRQFIQQYANSDLADNAQYWIGEVYYAQGRYANAIEEFEKVIQRYRQGDKVSAALLKIGYAYISIEEIEQGKLYLEEVIQEYPDSQEANLAKGRLASLK
ncbi:MAG: tol-pal system protein YbgF [bacterium]